MIESRTELIAEIGNYLDRDDLAARAPTFIQLTEARLNRLLSDPEMEVRTEAAATGDYTALPNDFGEMVSVSTGDGNLHQVGPVEFAAYDRTVSGTPRHYVIVDGSISFAPANSTTPIYMVYRRTLPALTDINPSNWLLARAPDVYLYGSLVQASAFLAEDDRLPMGKDAFDESVAELRLDGFRRKWGAGPLSPRIGRT
jgi:hypothetical protein